MKSSWITSVMFLTIFLLLIAIVEMGSMRQTISCQQENLDYYHTNFLRKAGGVSFYNNKDKQLIYDIRSFDGGKIWYSTRTATNDALVIDGPVELVYPGLMSLLQSWDNIENYAKTNGPINFTNQRDIKILENNGFKIIQKTNDLQQ